MKYGLTKNFVGGRFVDSGAEQIDLLSPLDGSAIGKVPLSGGAELEEAVAAARKALPYWSALTFKARSEVLYNYRQALKQRREELAEINHVENGKTIGEARAGIDKAVELTEFACSIPQMVSGRIQEVSRGVTCWAERVPVGIVASITPFNFPVMVPHWTVPNAIALGNAMILKPSELTPVCARVMAEIWKEAGLPDGIFNIVNGGRAAVEAICDHPEIRAISFVGSTAVAQQVYRRASSHLKAVLALGGAKNHLVLAPDAHPEMAARDILASFTGMSGQRCMAASVLICVGNVGHILEQVREGARKMVPGRDLPPLITAQALRRIRDYLAAAENDGAKILVDGRSFSADGPEGGYYIGPSVIDFRGAGTMPPEEIFGPTLEILGAKNLGGCCRLATGITIRQRRLYLHPEWAVCPGCGETVQRRYVWREHRHSRSPGTVLLWRLERFEIRDRRHHGRALDRLLDPIEKSNREMEPTGQDGLDELMETRRLRIRPENTKTGVYQEITPDKAGWDSLCFQARRMNGGERWNGNTGDSEWAIVLLGGSFSVRSSRGEWKTQGTRKSVFSGLPHALYLPPGTEFELVAESSLLDLGCGSCRADREFPARLIMPDEVEAMGIEIRGGDNATRQINSILPPGAPCSRLVCVEVYTPAGSWSSYPPHKHDHRKLDDEGNLVEACLEETYFYKIDKPGGFALQRVYSRDDRLDEVVVAENDDVVLVPFGYHPVAAAPGYNVYYLNFLSGSDQSLKGTDDPDHRWLHSAWDSRDPRVPLVNRDMNKKDC